MKFDVVIGNPPYQELTGGGGNIKDAVPLYHMFIEKAIAVGAQYINMLIPSRWVAGGKSVLDGFRSRMVESNHLSHIYNYERAYDIFETVDISGGIMYFLYDRAYTSRDALVVRCEAGEKSKGVYQRLDKYTYRTHSGKLEYMIVLDGMANNIINKVMANVHRTLADEVLRASQFGLETNFSDSGIRTATKFIRVLCGSNRETYTDRNSLAYNLEVVDKWKVMTGTLSPNRGGLVLGRQSNVINKPRILKPNEVCTSAYLVVSCFDTEEEAIQLSNYLSSRLIRYLIQVTLTSSHVKARNCIFIPADRSLYGMTEEELYQRFNIDSDEIAHINHFIKEWDTLKVVEGKQGERLL